MGLSAEQKKIEKDGKVCLKRAKNHQKKFSQNWDSNKQLMFGRIGRGAKNGIAEAYGLFRSLVSNILTQAPGCYFEAKQEAARPIASFLGDAVDYDFRIGNLHDRMVRALWQNFPYGYGCVAEQVETVHRRDEKGKIAGIKGQRFFWKNLPPRDTLYDPDGFCTDLSDHRFTFMAFYKTVKELREAETNAEEKLYLNLDKIEDFPTANETTRETADSRNSLGGSGLTGLAAGPADNNPDFHQLKLWRWYDRVNETISDFLDADGRLVAHQPWPLLVKIQGVPQFPFAMLAMNTEADDFYPIPEVDLIRPQLLNLARLNDQMMTDLTSKIRKYIGLSPYLDQVKMGKLLDLKSPDKFVITGNIDVAALQAGAPKVDTAADCIAKLADIEADPQLPGGMAEIRAQIQNISAYGSPSRGGLPQIRSAKEASRVADQVNKSLLNRQTPLEQFVSGRAMYHVLILKLTAPDDSERYFRITDDLQAVGQWLKYSPNQIPDEDDLFCDVYPGSSTPQNLDGKKAQFLEEMRVMSPILMQSKLSLIPLLYRWAKVFNVKYINTLTKNQKGAAQEFLAATIRAAQLGDKAPPELLIKAGANLIDSVLDPSEKQQVVEAMQQQGPAQGGGSGSNMGQLPSPTMGTQDGVAAT